MTNKRTTNLAPKVKSSPPPLHGWPKVKAEQAIAKKADKPKKGK